MPVNPVVGVNVMSPEELMAIVPFVGPNPATEFTVESVSVAPGCMALSLLNVLSVTGVFNEV